MPTWAISVVEISADLKPLAQPILSKPYRRFALGLLLLIYTLNFLDRQIVSILAEPIKQELKLSDGQLGLMTGLSFALFYTVLGIPIARLADKGRRNWIISGALALWSLFTFGCGLSRTFVQLLIMRVGVGVGEAGCSPSAHSLISDYAPKEERASALAIYAMGIPLGSLAGMALGGVIADAYGWRAAFMLVGGPGVILAGVAALALRETRTGAEQAVQTTPQTETPTLGEVMRALRRKPGFWWISLAAGMVSLVGYGHLYFLGSFFVRAHGAELAPLASAVGRLTGVTLGPKGFLGTSLGLIIGVFGGLGSFFGGKLTDHFAKRDARAYALLPAAATVLAGPLLILAFLTPSAAIAMALLPIPILLGAVWYGPVFACVQGLTPPAMRATAAAILLFVVNLIGLGMGPTFTGAISDLFAKAGHYGPVEGLRISMIVTALMGVLAIGFFALAARTLREEMES